MDGSTAQLAASTCPGCNHVWVRVQYVSASFWTLFNLNGPSIEHMKYTCVRCGYKWTQYLWHAEKLRNFEDWKP